MTNDLNSSQPPQRGANYIRRRANSKQPSTRTDIPYTPLEQIAKRYTVGDAVAAARMLLKHRRQPIAVCMDSVSKDDLKRSITLVELNEIQSRIVTDSIYHT